MKIIFMGTPALAVPALEKLVQSAHEVKAVVTQPDKASGRGNKIIYSPVKQFALDHSLPLMQPETINDESVMDELEAIGADIFAVVAYAQKIPDRILHMAPYGCINMHPSLLPKYRGSAPFRGPILYGDEVSGVTIMKLVQKWDAGDILMQKTFPVEPTDTALSLEEKAVSLGAQMLLDTIDGLQAGSIIPVPQDESKATYLKQIRKEEGLIDFANSATAIERQIRACVPWPSAYTYLDGKLFKFWEAEVIKESAEHTEAPGTVMTASGDTLIVRCGTDCLKLKEVQLEGKKRMSVSEFLRGRKIEPGTLLGN